MDTYSQLWLLAVGVKLCARKYNEAKAQVGRLEEKVKSRCDGLVQLEQKANALCEMLEWNNADARKMRQLSVEIQVPNGCSEGT